MRLLFDTHTFLWWTDQQQGLSPRVIALCQNSDNTLLLSVVSIWEMQIKTQSGKLKLSKPFREFVEKEIQRNEMAILPVALDHVLTLESLPLHHRDPFDRLLVAQAISENAALLSSDRKLTDYPVQVVW